MPGFQSEQTELSKRATQLIDAIKRQDSLNYIGYLAGRLEAYIESQGEVSPILHTDILGNPFHGQVPTRVEPLIGQVSTNCVKLENMQDQNFSYTGDFPEELKGKVE